MKLAQRWFFWANEYQKGRRSRQRYVIYRTINVCNIIVVWNNVSKWVFLGFVVNEKISSSRSWVGICFFLEIKGFSQFTFRVIPLMHSRVRRAEYLIWGLYFNFMVAFFTVSIIVPRRWNFAIGWNCELPDYSRQRWSTFQGFLLLFISPAIVIQDLSINLSAFYSAVAERKKMYAIVLFETLVTLGTQRFFCSSESFGADVLRSQFVCCLTSCGDHSIEHVCRNHVSVKFEQVEIQFLLTISLGS